MPTVQIVKTYSVPGANTLQQTVNRVGENIGIWGDSDAPITLNPAVQMSAYAEGAANVVTGNLTAGHGQTSGTYDFYWQESGVNKCRYGVPVTVTVNAIETTDAGSGDNFPTTPDAQPVLCKQKEVGPMTVDGDSVSVYWAALKFGNVAAVGRGNIVFQEDDGTDVGVIAISGVQLGVAVVDFDATSGLTNPITGEIVGKAMVTHNDLTYTPTFELRVLTGDVTP